MMTEDGERNPSPPREFEDNAETFRQDIIGNTIISKKWVYTVLMKMCTEADRQQKHKEADILDLPEDVQDDMCQLWDLCIEEDVANFLIESDAIELLRRVLSASKSPRLTEIIIGILGNIACSDKACEALSQSPEVLLAIVSQFSCRDSMTLVELGRLVATCLSNESHKDAWLDFIESNILNFKDDVTFILSSCRNISVLKYILEVVDICLDSRDSILMSFSNVEFSNAVAETGMQLLQSDESGTSAMTSLHILYLVTTIEDHNTDIFALNGTIFEYISNCCKIWAELDDFNIADHNPSPISLACCLTICFTLLESSLSLEDRGKKFLGGVTQLQKDDILSVVKCTLQYCSTNSSTENPKQVLQPNREESTSENTSSRSMIGNEKSSDELVHAMPLRETASDLMSILKKLDYWEK